MTLTIKQLCYICGLMGIQFTEPDADAMETEVWIGEGVIAGEDGAPDYHGLIAHDAEYPEEGAIALDDKALGIDMLALVGHLEAVNDKSH